MMNFFFPRGIISKRGSQQRTRSQKDDGRRKRRNFCGARRPQMKKKNRSRKTLRRVYSLTNCSDIFKGIGEATLYKKKKKKQQ
jgi:hypothetical protein